MTTYKLVTAGVAGSDAISDPSMSISGHPYSQWQSSPNVYASAPPGSGDDVISANIVSVPGLYGTLSVKTWTVVTEPGLGNVNGVSFVNGTLTIDTIIISGNQNSGIVPYYQPNPYDGRSGTYGESGFAILNVNHTPVSYTGLLGTTNAENVGENYRTTMTPWTIIDEGTLNAQNVGTTGADHITAMVDGGTMTVSDHFNDYATLDVSEGGTVTINGEMDPAKDNKTGPFTNAITIHDRNSSFTFNGEDFAVGGGSAETGIRGTFTVSGGARATLNADVSVGKASFDVGTVTVTGAGSELKVNGDFNVADKGAGTLNVAAGSRVTVYGDMKEGVEGGAPLGSGGDTIGGQGTSLEVHGEWQIGVKAVRTDTVNGGASATVDGDLTLGVESEGQGTLNVSGQGTTLTISAANAEVVIGSEGVGVLNVTQGANFDAAASDVTVGDEAGGGGGEGGPRAQNLLNIDAATVVTGNLTIGGGGSGNLTMENGAELSVLADLSLGDESGSKYSAQIQFSTLTVGGDLTIGNEGSPGSGVPVPADQGGGPGDVTGGNMLLRASTASATSITLGAESGSKGALVMDLSVLTSATDWTIGQAGSGTALIQLGSRVSAQDIVLGEEYGGTGSLTIDQGLVIGKDLTVGSFGKGTVNVNDGGILITTGTASIADQIVANIQSVKVTSAAWGINEDLQVGEAGLGQLTISQRGIVQAHGDIVIGDLSSGGGTISVKGTGSGAATPPSAYGFGNVPFGTTVASGTGLPVTPGAPSSTNATALQWGKTLTVGASGVGTLSISNGGLVAPLADGTGRVEVATDQDSIGTISLSGGSLLIATDVVLGGTDATAGGTASLSAGNKDVVRIADELTMWSGAKISLSGGGAVTIGTASTKAGSISIGTDGTLRGAGSITGGLIDKGLVDVASGTLTLKSGTLTGSGTVEIESGGTLDLSHATSGATIAEFDDSGELLLGSQTLIVTGAYTNADWGSGNSFDATAGVTGTGKIIGKNAALKITGDDVWKNGSGAVLMFHSVAGGLEQATFAIENSGTGAAITAALETAGLTVSSVSGISDGNITLSAGESSGLYTLTYDPSQGALNGQTLKVVSDFGNVAAITIKLQAASAFKVASIDTSTHGAAGAGESIQLVLTMSGPATVDTSGGSPALDLNNGATATFNAAASDLGAGKLVFDYTVAAGQNISNLGIVDVDLGGAAIADGSGNPADFSAAAGASTGLQIGQAFVSAVTTSQAGEADSGQALTLTLHMNEGVTVHATGGAPTLTLSDGASASYDAAASNPANGSLVFDYLVGPNDHSPDIEITAVNAPAGTTIEDHNGSAVDFSGALLVSTALQIGASPLTVTGLSASQTGMLQAGTALLTLSLSEAAIVNTTNGDPMLMLSNGANAIYDADLSDPSSGKLIFGYTVSAGDFSANLIITGLNLNGATVQDANGYNANFAGVVNAPTGIETAVTGVRFDSVPPNSTHLQTGDILPITLNMSGAVSVTGAPQLLLSDGATASYDVNASDPAGGQLVFDFTVGSGDYTNDLRVSSVSGGSVVDQSGHAADLSGAVEDLGLDVNAVYVASLSTSPINQIVAAGSVVQFVVNLSNGVTVTGTPTLALSSGGSAVYDKTASNPVNGILIFNYTVGATDKSPDLSVTGIGLTGATIIDQHGNAADLTAAANWLTGLEIGSPLTVASVASSVTGEADAGQTVQLTIAMSEAVTVNSALTLALNDGGVATYDANASTPASGQLVFDYVVSTSDSTANLAVTAINALPGAVQDAQGFNADFSKALNAGTGLQIGAAVVTGLVPLSGGDILVGQTAQLILTMSAPVTVAGAPTLSLTNGATATFDTVASTPSSLVFDYTVDANDETTTNLAIAGINLPAGASIVETADGANANLNGAVGIPTGLLIGSPLTVSDISTYPYAAAGPVTTGTQVQITIELTEGATLDTTHGLPTLTLNDGGVAIYDADTSSLSSGFLQFDYTVAAGEQTTDLEITAANLNGATLTDADGYRADLSGALDKSTGLQINPPPVATQVEINADSYMTTGDETFISIRTNLPVNVTGTPVLLFNDGGSAPLLYVNNFTTGDLEFDYTVAAGEQTPDLKIVGIDYAGGSITDNGGTNYDFSSVINQSLGVEVNPPLSVASVSATPGSNEIIAGQTVQFTVQMTEPVIFDTTTGAPSLPIYSGYEFAPTWQATATYDSSASDPSSGKLVFDYTVAAGDDASNIQIGNVALNGATITDAGGYRPVSFDPTTLPTAQSTDLQFGPAFVSQTYNGLDFGALVKSGDTVQLYMQLTGPAAVAGSPTLTLNNDATATYDAQASNPNDGLLVFDYTVGSHDDIPALQLSSVNLPGGASVVDGAGQNVNFATAAGDSFFLQIGPDTVTSVTAGNTQIHVGDTTTIDVIVQNIDLTISGGTPSLTLSNGGIAIYDPNESTIGDDGWNRLEFDYTAGINDQLTDDIEIKSLNTNGATIADVYGTPVDFSGALNVPTGVEVLAKPTVPVSAVAVYNQADDSYEAVAGQTVEIDLYTVSNVTPTVSGGTPTLVLSNGAIATYNPTESAANSYYPRLSFDYVVQPGDEASNLRIQSVNLNGATVTDSSDGESIDFSGATQQPELVSYGVPSYFQIGQPLTVQSVTASASLAIAGDAVQIALQMSEAVQTDDSMSLALSNGATATFDAGRSNLATGLLVFDYDVASGDKGLNLTIVGENDDGVTDAAGYYADFSGALTSIGLEVTPLVVRTVTASPGAPTTPDENVHITLLLSEGVTVDSSGGPLTLTLNDGGTATFDANASRPSTGALVFDYIVGAHDASQNLAVTSIAVPAGTTIEDMSGFSADLSGAINQPTGLRIGATPLLASSVTATPHANEAGAGQHIALTITMNEAVTIDVTHGSPTLSLNDGGVALFDAAASNPANGVLTFDYVVGAGEATPDLEINSVHLGGATIKDAAGNAPDWSAVLDASTGLQVGRAFVASIQSYENDQVSIGDTVHLAAYLSGPVTVNGLPDLILNTGSTADYDANLSDPLNGLLVFDFVAGSGDVTPNLEVVSVDRPPETTVLDKYDMPVDFSGAENTFTDLSIACYCPGTLIKMKRGQKPVEKLQIGDKVMTMSGVARPVKWIGKRSYAGRFVMGRKDILPICIKAGALDENIPRRDLWISPHHAMYLENVLIEARDLVNGVSIVQSERFETVEYFHIELDTHDVIIAEGSLSESFVDDDSRGMFHNAHEYSTLYPDLQRVPVCYCAPRLDSGYAVEAARQRIDARAGLRPANGGRTVSLRGSVDVVSPLRILGWAQSPKHPEAPVCLDVFVGGRLIGQTLANRYRGDLADAGLGSGRHGFEFKLPVDLAFTANAVEVRRSFDGARLSLGFQGVSDCADSKLSGAESQFAAGNLR